MKNFLGKSYRNAVEVRAITEVQVITMITIIVQLSRLQKSVLQYK